MELEQFFKDFQDHLARRLDTYEQAVYLYVFRHTRFIGLEEAVIGFKSARRRMACGIGEKGKPKNESRTFGFALVRGTSVARATGVLAYVGPWQRFVGISVLIASPTGL